MGIIFAEKHILKLVKLFSGHSLAIKVIPWFRTAHLLLRITRWPL